MSSGVKWDLAGARVIATSKVTIATATTTTFDFGTPDDINLAGSYLNANDRLALLLTASTAGTTDSITWVIQDADDSSGSIGTPATAVISAVSGALAAGTGDDYSLIAIKLQPGRPWLRVKVTSGGATDTFVCHATLLGIPSSI